MGNAAPAIDVFRAVADPTRRGLLDLLRESDRSVTDLARPFDMSQPAISQHLRVLQDAGLVRARRVGRQRVYRLHSKPLREAFEWLQLYEQFWSNRLDALGKLLDESAKPTKRRK